MLENEGAGADDDVDGQGGSGAPSGGSSEDGSENDDKPITAKQLKAALVSQKRHYEGQLAGQRAEFEAFKEGVGKQQQKPILDEKPRTYTKAELKAAVDGAQISQEQADSIWEQQFEAQITERAEAKALDAVSAKQAKERIDADLAEYKRLAPEILDKSSDERQKIVAKFQRMVANGLPNSYATELEAIEAVLGPLDKLKRSRSAGRIVEHDEQGGGSGDRGKSGASKTIADKMDQRSRSHYQKQIDAGRYPGGWKDVEAELKHASPKRRKEMGLPA